MAKTNQTLWIIIGALGIGGLILLLRKPATTAATVPTRAVAVGPGGHIPDGTGPYGLGAGPGLGTASGLGMAPVVPTRETGVRGELISIAMQQTGLPEEGLTIRSLLASDIGLTTWSMNLSIANAWNTAVNTTVASDRFIAITGVSYAGTSAESVRITAGGSRLAEFSIERIPGITTTHHIDIRPVIVEQNQNITIDVYASAISTTDNVILEGITVEPRGRLLA